MALSTGLTASRKTLFYNKNERKSALKASRYGFNGKLKDNEVAGEGDVYDYGKRMYYSKLGRFLSVDPITKNFAWNSPYSYAENDVIRSIDLDGMERFFTNNGTYLGYIAGSSQVRTVDSKNVQTVKFWIEAANNPPKNSDDQYAARAAERAKNYSSLSISGTLRVLDNHLMGPADGDDRGTMTDEDKKVGGGMVGLVTGGIGLGSAIVEGSIASFNGVLTGTAATISIANGADDVAAAFTKDNESFTVSLFKDPKSKVNADKTKTALTVATFIIGVVNTIKDPKDIVNLIGTTNDGYGLKGALKNENNPKTEKKSNTKPVSTTFKP